MRSELTVPFQLKSADESGGVGRFVGLASVYNIVDLHGDVVMPGAFSKTIAQTGGEVPLLWQHMTSEPIGVVNLQDSAAGLVAKGEIDLDIPEGRRSFSALRKRYIKGLSIGYDTLQDQVENGVRKLLEVKLWEVSVVTFAANPAARVTDVKARSDREVTDFLNQLVTDMRQFAESRRQPARKPVSDDPVREFDRVLKNLRDALGSAEHDIATSMCYPTDVVLRLPAKQ